MKASVKRDLAIAREWLNIAQQQLNAGENEACRLALAHAAKYYRAAERDYRSAVVHMHPEMDESCGEAVAEVAADLEKIQADAGQVPG